VAVLLDTPLTFRKKMSPQFLRRYACCLARLWLQYTSVQGFLEWGGASGRSFWSSNHVTRCCCYA